MKPTDPTGKLQSGTTRRRRNSLGGHLHKRLNGQYLKADSPVVAKYYVSVMVNKKRRLHCLDTFDHATAKERMAEILAGKRLKSGNDAYLRNLIRMGEWAKEQIGMGVQGDVVKVADAWPAYELSRRRPMSGPRTMAEYKARWKQFAAWCEKQGYRSMRDVTATIAEDYARFLETPSTAKVKYGKHKATGRPLRRTASTVNTHLQLLRLVYRVLDPGWPNPFAGVVSALERDVTHYRRLTVDEVKALRNAAAGDSRTLIEIGYTTGLRLIDAATLKWDAIDWKAKTITVRPRKVARRKGPKAMVTPPIIKPLVTTLSAVDAKERHGYVLKSIGPVYEERNRRPAVNKALAALFRAAGIQSDARGHASFHSLRVTWQSLNDEAGTSRAVARTILGHTSPEMSDTYSRIDADAARVAIEKAIPGL